MQSQNNELNRLNEFKQMMMDSLSKQQKENHPLSEKLLQAIIMIHTLNDFYGVRAVNQNDQNVEFDSNWAKGKQNIYKLRYKINLNNKPEIVLFRIIDVNGELNVNFCIQGSNNLENYTIKSVDAQKDIKQKHVSHLNNILPKKQEPRQGNQPFLRPVPLMRPMEREPQNRPYPLTRPDNLPFNNPFGKEEYVGPNSSIFGNGKNPGFEGPDPMQRYDPVDPFDYKGRIEPPDEFQGFDEFGNPINKPKMPKGPFIPGGRNPFNQGPPGFGGGFGGSFGGFGQNNFF